MRLKAMVVGQLLAGVCLTAPCYAQTADATASTSEDQPPAAPAPVPQQTAQNDSGNLGEIVVTAQRRSQSLQDVPVAVAAVTSDDLTTRGMTDTRSLSVTVPSLSLSENGVSVTPFLRGVGSNQSNPNDEPSVATYIDGVYIPSPTGNIFSFNNVERIEVLRGPQGTLFGRNATGGVIQIVTRDPSQHPHLDLDVGYGNYETLNVSGYATAGLGPNLAADIAVVYNNNFDGYGRDIFRDQDIFRREEFAARTKWLLTAGSRTEIRLALDYSHLNSTGADYQLAQGVIGVDGVTSYPGKRRTDTDWRNVGDNEVYGGSLRIDHDLDFARFVSITGYRHVTGDFRLDQDATPLPFVISFINQFARNWSQEVQLLAPTDSRIDWLIGGYYFNARYAYTPLTIEGLAAAPFTRIDEFGSQNTESASAYGQVTVPLGARTRLTGGLRYTHEKQTTVGRTEADGIVLVPDIPQAQSFDRLTWRAALDHRFSPGVLAYLSYNRGIKSGGFNMINPGTPGYRPEVLDAFEGGLKTEFANHTVRINGAVYYYDYKDIQVFNITAGGGVLTQNAAAAEVYGFDLDLAWRVTHHFQIAAAAGYIHSEYTDFPNATFTPPSPLDGPQFIADATGNDLIYAPHWTFNVSGDYSIPTSIGEFRINGALAYRDSVYVAADNRLQIPAYTVVNASIGWTSTNNRWGIRVWARNLFNEDYYANRTEQALGDIQYLAPPRTVGVTFSVHM